MTKVNLKLPYDWNKTATRKDLILNSLAEKIERRLKHLLFLCINTQFTYRIGKISINLTIKSKTPQHEHQRDIQMPFAKRVKVLHTYRYDTYRYVS